MTLRVESKLQNWAAFKIIAAIYNVAPCSCYDLKQYASLAITHNNSFSAFNKTLISSLAATTLNAAL